MDHDNKYHVLGLGRRSGRPRGNHGSPSQNLQEPYCDRVIQNNFSFERHTEENVRVVNAMLANISKTFIFMNMLKKIFTEYV